MPTYRLPEFNLTCRVYTFGNVADPPRVSDIPCNLAWGKRVNVPSTGGTGAVGVPLMTMILLTPKDVDIRDRFSSTNLDAVEVPQGSGRFYFVVYCDNVGMGFPNEHRAVAIVKRSPFKTPDS